MSTRYIKLTNTYGMDCFVQPDDVKAVVPDSGKGSWTQVYLYGTADHRVMVRESAQQVIDLVSGALDNKESPSTSFLGRN